MALQHTTAFLTKQTALVLPEVNDETLFQLETEAELIKSQLEQQRTVASYLKKELEEVWRNQQSALYELTSVFIHRGTSPSWGHYFFYSRNLPEKPDEWFKYNDSDVTVVSKEEVLKDTTGENANPYLVSFVLFHYGLRCLQRRSAGLCTQGYRCDTNSEESRRSSDPRGNSGHCWRSAVVKPCLFNLVVL